MYNTYIIYIYTNAGLEKWMDFEFPTAKQVEE
jgi:hypothetical protein